MHPVSQVPTLEMWGQEEAIRGICQLEQLSLANCLLWTNGTLPRCAEDAKQRARRSPWGLHDVFRPSLDSSQRASGAKMRSVQRR